MLLPISITFDGYGSMRHDGIFFRVIDLLEKPCQSRGKKGEESGPAKHVNECPEQCLSLQLEIQGSQSGRLSGSGSEETTNVQAHHRLVLLEPVATLRYRGGDADLIQLTGTPYLRGLPHFANSLMGGGEQFNVQAVEHMFAHAWNIAHVKDAEMIRGKRETVSLSELFGIAKAARYGGY